MSSMYLEKGCIYIGTENGNIAVLGADGNNKKISIFNAYNNYN